MQNNYASAEQNEGSTWNFDIRKIIAKAKWKKKSNANEQKTQRLMQMQKRLQKR